jgi:uncharacterized protein YjcR
MDCPYLSPMTNNNHTTAMTNLEKRRTDLGMKLDDLCADVDIAPNTYRSWRRRGTSAFNVKRVSDALVRFQRKHKL